MVPVNFDFFFILKYPFQHLERQHCSNVTSGALYAQHIMRGDLPGIFNLTKRVIGIFAFLDNGTLQVFSCKSVCKGICYVRGCVL